GAAVWTRQPCATNRHVTRRGRATSRAASSSMPSVMVSIQLTRYRDTLKLHDPRRELAARGPAMITTVRSHRQATDGDGMGC
ncbi:MAG TPA: hypothetical protein VFC16_00265, partial [Nakamurella sp.]|nr:hypothetical protein [Nakamurella sp.]